MSLKALLVPIMCVVCRLTKSVIDMYLHVCQYVFLYIYVKNSMIRISHVVIEKLAPPTNSTGESSQILGFAAGAFSFDHFDFCRNDWGPHSGRFYPPTCPKKSCQQQPLLGCCTRVRLRRSSIDEGLWGIGC